MQVENDLAAFLPDHSEVRQGLDIMEEQFTTCGTARVFLENITFSEAEEIRETLDNLDDVQNVTFDGAEGSPPSACR